MSEFDNLRTILRAYPSVRSVARCERFRGSGFSGAELWRLATSEGELCLRRWPPEHPDEHRLTFIHAVLRRAWDRGVREIPLPLRTGEGGTFLRHENRLWELTPWMPGEAETQLRPSPERLRAAAQWLGRFHQAVAPAQAAQAPSPGLAERLELLNRVRSRERAEIARRLPRVDWPEFSTRAALMLAAFDHHAGHVGNALAEAQRLPCAIQPCIRDLWRDHVLFQGERVTGVIDFGATRVECVASDISRLLRSFCGNSVSAWRAALAAYDAVRPLSHDERRLLTVFDASGVLLSGVNWLRWICLEGRSFEHRDKILARLDEILGWLDPSLWANIE